MCLVGLGRACSNNDIVYHYHPFLFIPPLLGFDKKTIASVMAVKIKPLKR
jgi:hypothetical protein